MPTGGLTISAQRPSPWLTVRLDSMVPDGARLDLLARWNEYRIHGDSKYDVPLGVFLRQSRWLASLCVGYSMPVEWAEDARQILEQQQDDRRYLRDVLSGKSLSPPNLTTRLDGSRHKGGLRHFQERDLVALLALRNGANFSVPGAGKTAVTYALYEAERTVGRVERLLVVAPISAFDAWKEESKLWLAPAPAVHVFAGDIPHGTEVLLVNYQRLPSNYDQLAAWVLQGPTHVVLDEAHRIKRGWDGAWGSACLGLAPLAERRDILTGTPAPNHPRDLEAILDFAWPGQGRSLLPEGVFSKEPDSESMKGAAAGIAPLFVRTNKTEMGLPRPHVIPHVLAPGGIQAEIYAALRQTYAGAFRVSHADTATLLRMGRVVMYLLEAAANPALLAAGSAAEDAVPFRHPPLAVPTDSHLRELIDAYGQYETPAKLEKLAKILSENVERKRKTLVWSNFVRNLKTLAREFGSLQPALVYGAVPSGPEDAAYATRESELHRFRQDSDCWVLFANPAAMAEGVSLHRQCRDAVYFDRTFNAGHYLQSLDRIHRLGLDPAIETNIHLLMVEGTVDEVVDSRLKRKVRWLETLLEDSELTEMALPDEEEAGAPLESDEDVQALLAHLRGDDAASDNT